MDFERHQIPGLAAMIRTSKSEAIALTLSAEKCTVCEVELAPIPQLTKETNITGILPSMDGNLVEKAIKAVTKPGKFDGFVVKKLLYGLNVLTILFVSPDACYIVQMSISPEPNITLWQKLPTRPLAVAQVGSNIYIAYADQLQKLDYGKNESVFKDLGEDKIVEIEEFQGKLAILLFSNCLIIYDTVSQEQVKVRTGNISYISTNEFSVVGVVRNGDQLNVNVIEGDSKALGEYNVKKFVFPVGQQYQKLELLKTTYFDNFLMIFFGDNVNPIFCLAICQGEKQNVAHEILEMTETYLDISDISVEEVTRIIEANDGVFEVMQNSQVNPLIAEMFDCTEPFEETKETVRKINQVGEIKCQIFSLRGLYTDSVYHQKYLLCKGLLLSDFPISELFALSGNLFEEFKIVKPLSDIHSNIEMEQFVRDAYCATPEKLPEVVVFACLRYEELLPFLEFLINREEQRLDAFDNQPVYSMGNVRPLAAFLELVVESSCQYLDIAFEQFTNKNDDATLLAEIEQLDNLETIVESSVKIMELLVETREKGLRQDSEEIVREANYIIMSGRTFISISKIIKYFSNLGQPSSLLDITVPLTNDSAVQLGLEEQSFSNEELSESTFINEEVDNIVEGNTSILYTPEYGFYEIGEDMVMQPMFITDIPNYNDLYKELNMDGNTAIFSVISSICQIFANGEYIRLTLRNILEYILHSRAQLKEASNFVIKQFEAAIFSVVLIFGYIKMMRNQNQTEIFAFISDILPYVEEKTKITNQLFLLCKIFATIDSAGSENDADTNIVLRTYDNYRLYNELLLFGAGKLQDDHIVRENIPSAMQRLPLPFSMRDDLEDSQIQLQTAALWSARLSQLACTRNQFNLAKALANFAAATPFSYQPILWPLHPSETGTELYLRACLVDYVLNRNLQAVVAFVTEIRVFLNSFAGTESDCATNRRIASLYSETALGMLKWDSIYKLADNEDVSTEEVGALQSSGYQCKFVRLPYWKLPSALIMYQSISDIEKRVLLCFALQNNFNENFILVFLFQHDVYLCQQYMQAVSEKEEVNSAIFRQIQSKLATMPKFLYSGNQRATRIFTPDYQFASPSALLPSYFIDDMGRELEELEKSLAISGNFGTTELLESKKEEEPQAVVINQQAGMMNFLDLMRENKHVQNVKCVVGMPYEQPAEAEAMYARNHAQWANEAEYGAPVLAGMPQNTQFAVPVYKEPYTTAPPQEMRPQGANEEKVQPIVRETKAEMLRDMANRKKMEEQKQKEAAKLSEPRQAIIGQKEPVINLEQRYQGMAAQEAPLGENANYGQNNAQPYGYDAYAYPTYGQHGQPAYNQYEAPYQPDTIYQAGYPNEEVTAQQPEKQEGNPFARPAQQQTREFNPSQQPSNQYQGNTNYPTTEKAAFKPVMEPSQPNTYATQDPFNYNAKPGYNASNELPIENATRTTTGPSQVRRATFGPTTNYVKDEPFMQETAEYEPEPETKPGILKNKMEFASGGRPVKNAVAFDIPI